MMSANLFTRMGLFFQFMETAKGSILMVDGKFYVYEKTFRFQFRIITY